MRPRTNRPTLPLCALLALLTAAPTLAQPRVGTVVLTQGDVTSVRTDGARSDLAVRDPVTLYSRIETGRRSAAKMTFDPRGSIQLGENARVVLDTSTVDDVTGRRQSTLSLLVGRLRLALSPGADADVTLDTPSATIGVKGTDVRLAVDDRGATLVAVYEGEVTVTPKNGGPPLALRAPRMTVVEPGRGPTPPAFVFPEGGLHAPDAGGPDFTVPWERDDDGPTSPEPENLPIDRPTDVP
jgi:hypothetical protein